MIQLSVNNEIKLLAEGKSLQEALVEWGYAESKIAVAINREFVARSGYGERRLLAGDEIDIVKPVGGG